ncbi:MAG: alkaline phytoceramidase [Gemmatimonadaceae bacterium]
MHRTRVVRHSVVLLAVCAPVAGVVAGPRIPQPLAYHDMADARPCLGIPNCLNVLSNLPFAVVGVLGLAAALGWRVGSRAHFSDPWERWPYAALFAGVALTAVGSSYYHWAPDNARLVWDRLPMTVGFMGLLTAVVAERVSVSAARWLFMPFLTLGAASVAYWYWSEGQGAGDLRPYALVQFGSLLIVVLLLLLYPARYTGGGYLAVAFAAYVAAKALELADEPIFALGRVVSGHTLKHLAAAGSVACLVGMLRARTETMASPSGRRRQRGVEVSPASTSRRSSRRRPDAPEP